MSCGEGHRRSSDPLLLWLWCRPVAAAPIRPLAWELPYAAGVAPKKKTKNIVQAVAQWVKDLALLQLWLEFHPWPGNFHMPQVCPNK